jgi:lipid-A-disaccharide synthase-like uncharacterized protein
MVWAFESNHAHQTRVPVEFGWEVSLCKIILLNRLFLIFVNDTKVIFQSALHSVQSLRKLALIRLALL